MLLLINLDALKCKKSYFVVYYKKYYCAIDLDALKPINLTIKILNDKISINTYNELIKINKNVNK
jgi:hypothetical protein